jgi:hypothetical protein
MCCIQLKNLYLQQCTYCPMCAHISILINNRIISATDIDIIRPAVTSLYEHISSLITELCLLCAIYWTHCPQCINPYIRISQGCICCMDHIGHTVPSIYIFHVNHSARSIIWTYHPLFVHIC